MNAFTIVPPEYICSGMDLVDLVKAGVISQYTEPRKVVRDNGTVVFMYPIIGTVDDARPVWDF